MPTALVWIEYAFWAAIGVGILIRLSIALFRRRAGRRKDALRSALGPLMGAGAAQSAAYGWTPPRSMDAVPLDRSTETSEFWDRAPSDLFDEYRDARPKS